jgi:hypothetical protein
VQGIISIEEALSTLNALHGTRAEEVSANMRSVVTDVADEQKTAATHDVDMRDFIEDDEEEKEVVA